MKHISPLPPNVPPMILSPPLADTEAWEMSLINTVYKKPSFFLFFFFFTPFQASQVWQIKAVESLD